MRSRLVTSLLLALLFAPTVAAQGIISGRVVDAELDEPVPTASVAVLDGSEIVTGTTTGMDGRFRIENVPAGTYALEVSFLGYESARIASVSVRSGRTTDMGAIELSSDTELLGEVEVQAQRRTVQVEIDRLVYATGDDPLTLGGTGTDVLETIPSVEVDLDGNISLRGSGSVNVLINGRPAPVPPELVADYIASLPAEAIDRVEVLPNPSARYDPEGMAGVLNIVLREDADPGFGGSLSATTNSRGDAAGNALLTYGRGPWALSATASFRQDSRLRERTSLRINRAATPETRLDQTGLDDRDRLRGRFGVTAERTFGQRTSASLALGVDTRNQEEDSRLTSALGSDPERAIDETERRIGGDARLGLRHRFDADGRHRLEADARLNLQQRDNTELLLDALSDGFLERRSEQDRANQLATFDLDYRRPALGGHIEAGYSGFMRLEQRDFVSASRTTLDAPFENDPGLTNASDYALYVHALYGQLAREFGPLGLQAGLRLETATTDFTLVNEGETFTNAYTSAFPSVFLSYQLSADHGLRASYSRRIRRPRTHFYNPFPRFSDPINVYVGNPEIRPEYTDAFEIGYVGQADWGSLTLMPYARRSTDVIRYFISVREDGVTERSVDNLATSLSYGAEAVLSAEVGPLRGFVSAEGFRVSTDGEALGESVSNDAFGWGGRINTSFDMNTLGLSGLMVQGSARYRAPIRTEQGRQGARFFMHFAARQQLLDDRVSINLRLRDPFGLARFDYVLDQPRLYEEVSTDWGARRIDLTLSYRFNQPERRRDRDAGDDGFDEAP